MKQKIILILLSVTLMVSALNFSANAANTKFTDVSSSEWYYDAVESVSAKGWMNGIGDNRFAPDAPLTRAMLAVILWQIEGCPIADKSAAFTDTASNAWYAEGISWCVEKELFAGYPNGSFGPNDAVTREQLAVVFYRYANEKPVAGAVRVSVKNGCAWAADACIWANVCGLFTDAIGAIDLCAPASRAEIAYLLDQYFTSAKASSALTENSFGSMGYLLYTPANAQPDMPLIVYLHGGHGKGSNLSILIDTDGFPQYLADGLLGEVPAYVLIPQLPEDQRGWKPAAETLMQLIELVCEENHINRSRISLTGHSMGGTGTWDLALSYPDVFSRIAPMSGSVDTTAATLAALKSTPVWAFVGEDDVVVRPDSSERFIIALKQQNADAQIMVFPETDHVGVLKKAWLEHGMELLDWLLT